MAKMKELLTLIDDIISEDSLTEKEKIEIFSKMLYDSIKKSKEDNKNGEEYLVRDNIIGIPLESILLFLEGENV